VIVTSRFPRDTAERFARHPDFDRFSERLEIYGLDLRHTPNVEAFAAEIERRYARLDILVNNAAQTIARPEACYEPLIRRELEPKQSLPSAVRQILPISGWREQAAETEPEAELSRSVPVGYLHHEAPSAERLLDRRDMNSWRMRLHEIGAREMLEVQLVNNIAPFLLCARLRHKMMKSQSAASGVERCVPSFIVNVSAPEGQFYRAAKPVYHPHTNMAKAALNMMTRTAGQDYAEDRIYMTSVDPGWSSNENPYPIAQRMQQRGFSPPLDEVDAAARVCDPIVQGLSQGELLYGVLLKDFRVVPW
jgi:NAD(P)-dependent dehydrogenase (short-subunit alcohol dehydrogenase family)